MTTIIKTTVLALMALLMSATAAAAQHEKGEGPMLAAKPGQIVIVYYWPCADADNGMALLKEMIAYERDASPYPYSASPAIHADGALVSVDVHSSAESMEKATRVAVISWILDIRNPDFQGCCNKGAFGTFIFG